MLTIAFAGTPEFAAQHLQFLIGREHAVIAAYTQPDRRAGRGKKTTPSAVKILANAHHITVFQPESLKTLAAQEQLQELAPDVLVVVAYGLILPRAVLEIPRLGCINVHGSLLPRWRGAAPIQRAIEAGDIETGVTIMQMDEGLDTGKMIERVACAIAPTDTSAEVASKLCQIGGPALLRSLNALERGDATATTQDETESCYAAKIDKREALIDWSQSAVTLERKIRAFNPAPVAYSTLQGDRIKLWRASSTGQSSDHPPGTIVSSEEGVLRVACGQGSLLVEQIQLPGKSRMTVAEVLNSRRQLFSSNSQLGT